MKHFLEILRFRQICKKKYTFIRSFDISNSVKIGSHCIVSKRVILNDNIKIGNFTYFNANKYWITIESNVEIGSFCSVAPGVHIGAGNHNYNYVTTHPILFDKYYEKYFRQDIQNVDGLIDKNTKTIIGNDVWIGLFSIIKRGVKIGNGAVIAAGSVVVKDVPDYAIVGGNPAKIIKYRTSKENIDKIIENNDKMFWNWDEEKIISNFDILYDFDKFIDSL